MFHFAKIHLGMPDGRNPFMIMFNSFYLRQHSSSSLLILIMLKPICSQQPLYFISLYPGIDRIPRTILYNKL